VVDLNRQNLRSSENDRSLSTTHNQKMNKTKKEVEVIFIESDDDDEEEVEAMVVDEEEEEVDVRSSNCILSYVCRMTNIHSCFCLFRET